MSSLFDSLKLLLMLFSMFLASCATSTSVIGDFREPDGSEAESVFIKSVAASSAGKFDKPIVLLRAPQPVMPPADTTAGVVGRVVVQVTFNELGVVEAGTVLNPSVELTFQRAPYALWLSAHLER
jgi:hypothetical protein